MSAELPDSSADTAELLSSFLDYYRAAIARTLDHLDEADLRRSRLPSGWTPLQLLKHLTYMERRWFQWGLLAEQVDDPWGDWREGAGWYVDESETPADLLRHAEVVAARTREILSTVDLTAPALVGGRFETEAEAPTGLWIGLHVLQEYAQHAGHLDIVRELIDGTVGEG